MNKIKIYLIVATLLFLSVPWFFFETDEKIILGFPLWAIYSLSLTILFAITIVVLLERNWDSLSDGDDNE